jgi:hypothetical protein
MTFGRVLIVLGLAIAVLGALVQVVPGFRLGRLPGDVSFGGSGWRVYLPIGTSILLSLVLTLVFALVNFVSTRR